LQKNTYLKFFNKDILICHYLILLYLCSLFRSIYDLMEHLFLLFIQEDDHEILKHIYDSLYVYYTGCLIILVKQCSYTMQSRRKKFYTILQIPQ